MSGPAKILVSTICAVNAFVAFLWLFLFGRHYAFHLAGVHFSSGILAAAGTLFADGLAFVLLFKRSK